VAPADCRTEAGAVIHPDGAQTLGYGELAEPASTLDVPSRAPIKDASGFRILGRDVGHWDAPRMVTGRAVYGLDVRVPGMLFAALARCPVFGGTLVSFEDGAALAVPGVRKVIPIQDKVAVVADTSWAALRGRQALVVEWEPGANAGLDSGTLRAGAAARLPQPGSDSNLLDALYEMPFEAHATMEPMNCTAHVHDDVCEVWAPSQNPQDAQLKAAAAAGLRTEKVTVHVPLIGGAFGRRLQSDFVVEAVLASQAAGAPVQVVWTRDDDLHHDYYRDLTVLYASVARDTVSLPRVQPAGSRSIVPTGAWRSVDNFPQAYATGCFIDEMAAALGRDPLDLLLELYSGRAAAVIRLAAEKAGWGEPLPEGRGRGLAYHATFGVTHVAYVAEVSVAENGRVRVPRVTAAVDCGQVINPNNVRAQVEGGIVFGLTAALKSEAVLKDGRIQQSNFHDFPILRMDEMPVVEVHLIESDERPSGMGEMGVPPIAPAVANAVFAATGKRIRHIPIRPEDLAA
jgi:isoquinoline 1-oxidoreductase beta subunit